MFQDFLYYAPMLLLNSFAVLFWLAPMLLIALLYFDHSMSMV